MYIAFNNNTKRVVYVGKEKPGIGGDAIIAKVDTIPEKYDYLTVVNEHNLDGEIVCDLVANFFPTVTKEQREEILAKQNIKKEIERLKGLLSDTDYQAIKFAEGWLTEEEYSEIKFQRQVWRAEINDLQNQL